MIPILVSKMSYYLSVAIVLFFANNALSYPENNRGGGLTVKYRWKNLDFDYPNAAAEREAYECGALMPWNVIPLDSDYHPPTNRYFVTLPPFRKGVPASLGELTPGQGFVKPFPKWPITTDTEKNCREGPPLSVYRIHIDKCGLLWAPDTGLNEALTSSKVTCPPKLLVYDLNNFQDQEIVRYQFPEDVITDHTLIVNIVTESYSSDCSDTIAYMADIMDYGLIVFDLAKKTSWRIKHKYFRMFPTAPTMTVQGVSLDLDDGLVGLALSPVTDNKGRRLYFHSFASLHESWAPVALLKNCTLINDPLVLRQFFFLSPGTRAGHSTVQVMTDDGILIYPVLPDNTLACWNQRTPFTKENQHIIKRDDEKFQFISGLKLIGNKLLITSSRFQDYLLGKITPMDHNYRIMMVEDVKQFLQSTPCANPPTNNANKSVPPYGWSDPQSPSVFEPKLKDDEYYSDGKMSCHNMVCESSQKSSPYILERFGGLTQQLPEQNQTQQQTQTQVQQKQQLPKQSSTTESNVSFKSRPSSNYNKSTVNPGGRDSPQNKPGSSDTSSKNQGFATSYSKD